MDRVLAALLDNAFRHSRAGTPVRAVAEVVGNDLVVRIEDRGAGFTAEQGAVLFEPFRHARDPEKDLAAGAGLSLFLARGLVGLAGGRIWADSAGPSLGATFAVELPLRRPMQSLPQ